MPLFSRPSGAATPAAVPSAAARSATASSTAAQSATASSTAARSAVARSAAAQSVSRLAPSQLAQAVRRFAEEPALWRSAVRFQSPERWYRRLELTPHHEIWLLTWLPGQGTEIHDHGGSCGAFAVVGGELTERTFPAAAATRPSRPRPWVLSTGSIRAFGPQHIHEVSNCGLRPAISVHAYSPALANMSYYRHGPDGCLRLDRTDAVATEADQTVNEESVNEQRSPR